MAFDPAVRTEQPYSIGSACCEEFLSYNEKNVWWNAWSDVATGNSRQRWLGKMKFPQGDLDVIEEVRAAKAIKFALQSIETVSVRFADRNAAEPIVAIGVLKAP